MNISFIVPAFNCEATVAESVRSILEGNLRDGDEIVLADDGSTDGTRAVLDGLAARHPEVRILALGRNRGAGAARNAAIDAARHPWIFALDADNLLIPGTVPRLAAAMEAASADCACIEEVRFFKTTPDATTHVWRFEKPVCELADLLASNRVAAQSANYLYTRDIWARAGGYPAEAGAIEGWGFGWRKLAAGARMIVVPGTAYLHRYGHSSWWVRSAERHNPSLGAMQVLIPYLHLIDERDIDYMLSRRWRTRWYDRMERRPIRLRRPGGRVWRGRWFALIDRLRDAWERIR